MNSGTPDVMQFSLRQGRDGNAQLRFSPPIVSTTHGAARLQCPFCPLTSLSPFRLKKHFTFEHVYFEDYRSPYHTTSQEETSQEVEVGPITRPPSPVKTFISKSTQESRPPTPMPIDSAARQRAQESMDMACALSAFSIEPPPFPRDPDEMVTELTNDEYRMEQRRLARAADSDPTIPWQLHRWEDFCNNNKLAVPVDPNDPDDPFVYVPPHSDTEEEPDLPEVLPQDTDSEPDNEGASNPANFSKYTRGESMNDDDIIDLEIDKTFYRVTPRELPDTLRMHFDDLKTTQFYQVRSPTAPLEVAEVDPMTGAPVPRRPVGTSGCITTFRYTKMSKN